MSLRDVKAASAEIVAPKKRRLSRPRKWVHPSGVILAEVSWHCDPQLKLFGGDKILAEIHMAERLHAWLGQAIRYMKQEKKRERAKWRRRTR